MTQRDKGHGSITSSDQQLVLSSLEPEQLARLKKHLIPPPPLERAGEVRDVVSSNLSPVHDGRSRIPSLDQPALG